MEPDHASWTAIGVAYLRAYHFKHDSPYVFADPFAPALVSPEEGEHVEQVLVSALAVAEPELAKLPLANAFERVFYSFQAIPEILARARFNEDCLEAALARGIDQYVVVGAGLDTFALRRPDLRDRVSVFELDHPSSQAFKLARMRESGLTAPSNLHFAPIDFEREDVKSVLRAMPAFEPTRPAFFSWLGVTQYLSLEAISGTFTAMREATAPGSEVVFGYFDAACFDPATQSPTMRQHFAIVEGVGEPFLTGLEPPLLGNYLEGLGYELLDNLGPKEQEERYFTARRDGLKPGKLAYVARARTR